MKFSVIIPCYNSTPILRTLILETKEVFHNMGVKEYEFILVNDCSPNLKTVPFLKELANEFF